MMFALVYGNTSKRLLVMSTWEQINHVLRSSSDIKLINHVVLSDIKTSTPASGFIKYGPLFGSILRCLQLHRNLQFEPD